jgi:hypothetical protein
VPAVSGHDPNLSFGAIEVLAPKPKLTLSSNFGRASLEDFAGRQTVLKRTLHLEMK